MFLYSHTAIAKEYFWFGFSKHTNQHQPTIGHQNESLKLILAITINCNYNFKTQLSEKNSECPEVVV